MHPTHNTLPETARLQSIDLLGRELAAAIDLQLQLKHAHWNVRGPGFLSVHELFDRAVAEVAAFADLLAERIAGLGGAAHGTVQSTSQRSYLVPYSVGVADTHLHVFATASALASFGQSIRDGARTAAGFADATTSDLLTQISRGTDQLLWLVEAHAPVRSDSIAAQ